MGWNYFAPYVPVAEKKANVQKEMEKLRQQNKNIAPVVVEGRKITTTWWGNAWCENLKSYADYGNRLQRGSAYCKNGFVVDLQINEGEITAQVMGSQLYRVTISIDEIKKSKWNSICIACAKRVASMAALVEGAFPKDLADIFIKQDDGLFPTPKEIHMECTCPDYWEGHMCKHIAAVMYGVGNRLDSAPLLFFKLRGVDASELIKKSVEEKLQNLFANADKKSRRIISDDDTNRIFGDVFSAGDKS